MLRTAPIQFADNHVSRLARGRGFAAFAASQVGARPHIGRELCELCWISPPCPQAAREPKKHAVSAKIGEDWLEPPSAATPMRSVAGTARGAGENRPTTAEGVSINVTGFTPVTAPSLPEDHPAMVPVGPGDAAGDGAFAGAQQDLLA